METERALLVFGRRDNEPVVVKLITKDTQLESWSMGKSLAATLFALLVRDGTYTLELPAPVPVLWKNPPPGVLNDAALIAVVTRLARVVANRSARELRLPIDGPLHQIPFGARDEEVCAAARDVLRRAARAEDAGAEDFA